VRKYHLSVTDVEVGFPGQLAKVASISDDRSVVYYDLRSGQTSFLSTSERHDFQIGDVLLVGASQARVVPPDLWSDEKILGIVRKVEDDQVLVEVGSELRWIPSSDDLPVKLGNTVEFSRVLGPVRIVSDTPIRALDRGDNDLDVERFRVREDDRKLDFSDFGGNDAIVTRVRELISTQLEKRALLDKMGARPIRGVLFAGPPGTGKTLLARILASQSKASFFLVSGPAIVSKWVGDSEELLRNIFTAASSEERAVIFFDEIDSIAGQRGETSESSNRLVAQFLTLMDGSQRNGNVVVVAATNRPNDIDAALLRPGRFDWVVQFELPDEADRRKILETSGRTISKAGDMPLDAAAKTSEGWSAAELSAVWAEAALIAASADRPAVWDEDFAVGFARIAQRRNES
jgi:transitional endoplasmic reticulum ATPase